MQRMNDEVNSLRYKLASTEHQAKLVCESWKREATEQNEKMKAVDRERMQYCMKLGEVKIKYFPVVGFVIVF